LEADGVSIGGGNIDGTPIGAATPASGMFTTLNRTTITQKDMVLSRMFWYGNLTGSSFSTTGVRTNNLVGNKTYAVDIPLGYGSRIMQVVVRIVSNQTMGGTFKLQKALFSDTAWSDVASGNITASGTTSISPNYTIESGYAVRVFITYTASGGTYSYHYPVKIIYQDTEL